MRAFLLLGDNRFVIDGIHDTSKTGPDRYITANVTVTIESIRDAETMALVPAPTAPAQPYPRTLTYVVGTQATWSVVLGEEFPFEDGRWYVAETRIAGALGTRRTMFVDFQAVRDAGPVES